MIDNPIEARRPEGVEISDAWSCEDLDDLSHASISYAARILPDEEIDN
jgi:hypothetical protein